MEPNLQNPQMMPQGQPIPQNIPQPVPQMAQAQPVMQVQSPTPPPAPVQQIPQMMAQDYGQVPQAATTAPAPKRGVAGTVLVVLNMLSMIAIGILIVVMLLPMFWMSIPMLSVDALPVIGMLGFGTTIIAAILVVPFLIQLLIVRGLMRGSKVAVIILMIFTILGLISAVMNSAWIQVAISGLMLTLEILCLKDPYYHKKR